MTLHVCKHSNQLCSVIFMNYSNLFNNDVIMSSLDSAGNCKLGHDCLLLNCELCGHCVGSVDTEKWQKKRCAK